MTLFPAARPGWPEPHTTRRPHEGSLQREWAWLQEGDEREASTPNCGFCREWRSGHSGEATQATNR